ncbi:hypothetical protein [Rhodococcus koreensis]|uniref:Recombinase n=1 Tax=Rhodococcus koreensis TaxID=99653 RepID=A0A1H4I7Y6_9NOCA|nr:hypothetical protein [Rhodococcus koreensis]SEB29866.1 hypothetical protein SAMN04490239_0156 [Rhodococcus koreensis]
MDRASQHVWGLFTDWCTAVGLASLPADPVTVAMFLGEHPTAPGTQRRRVGVINAVHRRAGLPQPGRSELVRDLLDAGRTARRERAAAAIANRIVQLPLTGSPAGLFGRRDALLLALAATLRFEQIARLRRNQVSVHVDTLLIHLDEDGPRRLDLPTTDVVAVYHGWLEVLGFLDRYPSTSLLAQSLGRGADLTAHAATARRDDRPLLTPIDRWGHTPYVATALTGQSVATVVRAHLTGHAPTHERVHRQPATTQETPAPTKVHDIILDSDYYERGIRARANAHTTMSGVTDVLGDIEDRADQLLADLLSILEAD